MPEMLAARAARTRDGAQQCSPPCCLVPFPCARCLEQDWCPNGLSQVKVCTAVSAQEGRDEQGGGVVGPGAAYVIMNFCLCQSGEWGLSVSLFPALAQSQHVLKTCWYSFPLRYWGVHPVTSCAFKQSVIQALAVLQLVCHLRYFFFLPTFFLMICY